MCANSSNSLERSEDQASSKCPLPASCSLINNVCRIRDTCAIWCCSDVCGADKKEGRGEGREEEEEEEEEEETVAPFNEAEL